VQLTYPLQARVAISEADQDQQSPTLRQATDAEGQIRAEVRPPVDQVIAYLSPFLVMTAISMATGLFAGAIDWLYPLRVIGVVVTLWVCRSAYSRSTSGGTSTSPSFRPTRSLFAWEPIAIGLAVFMLWAWVTRPVGNPAWVPALHEAPRYGSVWLAIRLAGFALVVPLAEELAFRGYLPRRLVSADVESVNTGAFAWMPFVASSIWFGAVQGQYWFVGTLQGMAYAAALYRRGRVGDAVLAHIVTNVAIAAYAFTTGLWAAVL
jgi:CAAX prenyl protease-like protein